jgi:hypothetical protein
MKKTTVQVQEKVESKGRRGARKGAGAGAGRAQLTVGDLIAAAYDALESEARDVMRVLSSPALAVAIRRRIVLV